MKKLSPTFLVAAVVVTVSLFVLLSMLFYGPSDYFEQGSGASENPYYGFRFTVASTFFGSFGIGAYFGWMIILAWAVIVFFRESVGDLAIRGISLAVVVVSGAALADLLGTENLGGTLGYAVGSVLRDGFGTALGVILIGAIFSVSLILATDFGFISYYKEARTALAIAEPEEDTPDTSMDLVSRIDRIALEVEAEAAAATEVVEEPVVESEPEAELDIPAPPADAEKTEEQPESADRPIVIDLRPPIEEESLDEDLDTGETAEVEEEPTAEIEIHEVEAKEEIETGPEMVRVNSDVLIETEPSADLAGQDAEEEEAEEEAPAATAEAAEEPARMSAEQALESVFDALVGPSIEPDPREAEMMRAAVVVEDDAEAEAAPELIEEMVVVETVVAEPVEETPAVETPPVAELDIPAASPEPEERQFILDDTIYITEEVTVREEEAPVEDVVEIEEPVAVEPVAEPEPEPEPVEEEAPARGDVVLLDDEIVVDSGPEIADDSMLPFMQETEAEAEVEAEAEPVAAEVEAEVEEEPAIPVLEDVAERGVFRSLFRKKQEPRTAPVTDPMLDRAADIIFERGRASVVLLQRRLDIGYTRAARIIETLQGEGLVGPLLESGSREILLTAEQWQERREDA
jgi:DNA segregation ATPase FtsK/SpoIIIE-like protein